MRVGLVRFFFPEILIQIAQMIKSYLRGFPYSTINQNEHEDEILCILGNGPSLIQSLEKYEAFIKSHDCIAVSHFAENPVYKLIKPKYYLLADPSFWTDPDLLSPWLREKILKAINAIRNNTTWHILVVLPALAKNSFLVTEIVKNEFIRVLYYNNFNYRPFLTAKKKFKLWDRNLIAPPAQTVINTAVYLGLFWEYQETYLFGIDSTFFNSLSVDQATNELFNEDIHFYGNKRRPWYIDSEGKKPARLHEISQCFTKMFELYWDLYEYSKFKGLKIYNASEYSMVDAFERKKPVEV